jgi:hypothetical protein
MPYPSPVRRSTQVLVPSQPELVRQRSTQVSYPIVGTVSAAQVAPPVVAQDSPLLEARDGVLDPSAPPPVAPPGGVSHDSIASKHGGDELGDAAVAAVCEHAAVTAAQLLDDAAPVVHRIVAVAGTSTGDGDDAPVGVTDEDLQVARPAIGLRLGCGTVIARRHEGAIDDPGATAVAPWAAAQERREAWDQIGDDAVHLRGRHAEHRGELAQGQVGA